jgi:uncharacterized protein YjbJ (UPF0337 family)
MFDGAQTWCPVGAINANGGRVVHRHERMFMNWDTIQGNWKQLTGHAKQEWGKLTGDDLKVVDGHRDQLAGKLQERYGIAKDVAEKQIKDWEDRVEETWLR